jgi:biopolymer transport protein ExbB
MRRLPTVMLMGLILLLCPLRLGAEDMRERQVEADQARRALLEQIAAEKRAAGEAAAQSRARILEDREALNKAVAVLQQSTQRLTGEVDGLQKLSGELLETEQTLTARLSETDSMIRELVGVVRVNAKDLEGLLNLSPQTSLNPADPPLLRRIADQAHFPGMADIRGMADMLEAYIQRSGQVRRTHGPIVDRGGQESTAEILVIGNFTTAYRTGSETGFLSFSADSQRLFALSRLPAGGVRKQISQYLDGRSEAVPMDISRGGALRQLTHQLSLWQQIPKGGPIVVPILLILLAALAIVAERAFFLWRQRMDADGLMRQLDSLARDNRWEEGRALFSTYASKPVARVVAAGLRFRHMAREDLENALQEAILKEVPPMERLLSTLGMLAAIAPLLGLLGTVTGMIGTFHVITLHGTGDPRLMSGGISEALVTTMLGLSVAIPIMLAHTLLSRGVDNMVGTLEEKAVALVNIVHQYRDRAA